MTTSSNTKNSIILTRGITDKDTPSSVNQETIEKLAKNVLTNMSNKELEKEEREVLCKMVVKGKASGLRNIVDQIFSNYYKSSGNYTKGYDKDLVVTLMIEKGDEEEVKKP
jgi:hypothetical protein